MHDVVRIQRDHDLTRRCRDSGIANRRDVPVVIAHDDRTRRLGDRLGPVGAAVGDDHDLGHRARLHDRGSHRFQRASEEGFLVVRGNDDRKTGMGIHDLASTTPGHHLTEDGGHARPRTPLEPPTGEP